MREGQQDAWVSRVTGEFSAHDAAAMVGCSILVGLIYVSPDGENQGRAQYVGAVEAVDRRGVRIRLDPSGELLTLPADPLAYEPAPPGDYQLYDSDRVVADPDLLTRWRVTVAADGIPHYQRRDGARLKRVEE